MHPENGAENGGHLRLLQELELTLVHQQHMGEFGVLRGGIRRAGGLAVARRAAVGVEDALGSALEHLLCGAREETFDLAPAHIHGARTGRGCSPKVEPQQVFAGAEGREHRRHVHALQPRHQEAGIHTGGGQETPNRAGRARGPPPPRLGAPPAPGPPAPLRFPPPPPLVSGRLRRARRVGTQSGCARRVKTRAHSAEAAPRGPLSTL